MSRLHEFERIVDEKLRKLFRGSAPQGEKRELIEVHRAILDDIAGHVESLPRGRRTFQFSNVGVRILVPDPGRRRSYEVAFLEAETLARDISGRLADEHAETPAKFHVGVELVDELPPDVASRGFDISYQSASASVVPTAGIPAIWMKVLSGKTDQTEYSFRKSRVNIGRLADIVDAEQRLIRRNDIAFAELQDAPNPTVSRTHAHIEFDRTAGQFRLFDDHSAQGTTVLRDGEIIRVAKGAGKGVQLRPGDEIVLGQARLSFHLQNDSETQ